jgi:hypothetical protein
MGFKPQSNYWQCGPFALKHALAVLGIFADEREIARIAGTDRLSGTDELQLARAARRFDCDLLSIRRYEHIEARHDLVSYLKQGIPCLLCAYEWSHWVTVVNEARQRFVVLDSRDDAVLRICTWTELESFWVFHRPDEVNPRIEETLYDFHPVVPRFRAPARADVSLKRARHLRRPENRELAKQWDKYVEDLLAICRPRTPLSSNVLSLGQFLQRHGGMMVDQVAYWHGWIEKRRARKVLENLRFVADTYGLVIHEDSEKRAIAGITALLTLWAGGRYGVTPVYQEVRAKRRRRRR